MTSFFLALFSFSQLMRVSAVIYTHQGKSHLKIALRLRETFLDKLS